MMRTLTKVWTLALALFFPVFVFAADISDIAENTVVNDEESVFRFRSVPGIWQKSDLEAEEITNLKKYKENIFFVRKNNSNWVLSRSDNGLLFMDIWSSSQQINTALSGNKLLAATDDQALLVDQNFSLSEVSLPGHGYGNPVDYLSSVDGQLRFFVERGDGVDVYSLLDSTTVPKWSYSCLSLGVIMTPTSLVECDDSVVSFGADPSDILSDVELVDSSELISIWKSLLDGSYYIYDGNATTHLSFSNFESGDELYSVSDRIFWRKDAALFEVAWRSDPVAIDQLPILGDLKATDNLKIVVLSDADNFFYSKSYASWTGTNLESAYDLLSEEGELIAYTLGGSEAFYEEMEGLFVEMDSSWAKSSKIKTIKDVGGVLLLVLRNSSDNPNIYKSEDYRSWKRITMPSKPTIITDIDTARSLPPNTLVELFGTVSVLPGFVSPNISYLADSVVGIQLYLSSTKGAMNLSSYKEVTAIGKISSGSVGRVLLDSPNHIIAGKDAARANSLTAIGDAIRKIGKTYIIKGELSDISKNSAVTSDDSGSIKLHRDGVKEDYLERDTLLIEVVVDYNSSSKKVEAWAIGEKEELVARKAPPETVAVKEAVKKSSSDVNKKSSSSSGEPKIAKAPVETKPVSLPLTTNDPVNSADSYEEARVLGVREDSSLSQWTAFLGGFLAAGLVLRGSRLKKFFV